MIGKDKEKNEKLSLSRSSIFEGEGYRDLSSLNPLSYICPIEGVCRQNSLLTFNVSAVFWERKLNKEAYGWRNAAAGLQEFRSGLVLVIGFTVWMSRVH